VRAELPNLQPCTDVKDILEVHLEGEHEVITLYEQARRVAEAPRCESCWKA
jgi:bacterioferritin (cytochrome b1)